jgi:hypothetical protein
VAGGNARTYDPVTLNILDSRGQTLLRNAVFRSRVGIGGKNGSLQWSRDGLLALDADEAEVDAYVPAPRAASIPARIRLAAKGGVLTESESSEALWQDSMPPVGSRTRRLGNIAKGSAQVKGQLQRYTPVLATIPKTRLRVEIPRLGRGERFELRLGGGGAYEERQ